MRLLSVLREQSGQHGLNSPADCPVGRIQSTLELCDKTLRVNVSKLIDDYG